MVNVASPARPDLLTSIPPADCDSLILPFSRPIRPRFPPPPPQQNQKPPPNGRPFPIKEHQAPQGGAEASKDKAFRQAAAGNRVGGQARGPGPREEGAAARRDHLRPPG